MKFPYKKFVAQSRPGGPTSVVSRPVLPVHLGFGTHRVACEALVDSGADYSIFHAQIGEVIGLEIRKGQRMLFAGVAGVTQEGFRHSVRLGVGKWRLPCEIVFAYGLKIPYGILGQAELFKSFVIVFDREAGWIDLKPRRAAP